MCIVPCLIILFSALPERIDEQQHLAHDGRHAFEHLMMQEIIAFLGYHGCDNMLSYWHTYSGYEVDAVLGDAKVAIEFKSTPEVQSRHLKGLRAFHEEHPQARLIIVSLDSKPRLFNGVEVMPATYFLRELWQGTVFSGKIIP